MELNEMSMGTGYVVKAEEVDQMMGTKVVEGKAVETPRHFIEKLTEQLVGS